jgi:hypothetical protein
MIDFSFSAHFHLVVGVRASGEWRLSVPPITTVWRVRVPEILLGCIAHSDFFYMLLLPQKWLHVRLVDTGSQPRYNNISFGVLHAAVSTELRLFFCNYCVFQSMKNNKKSMAVRSRWLVSQVVVVPFASWRDNS